MRLCDRCKQQTDSLLSFDIVSLKPGKYGSAIKQFDTEVCKDCHSEGKEILDRLGTRLDLAQREIMLEAKNEWLASPVTIGYVTKRPEPYYPLISDEGRTWVEKWIEKFKALFTKEQTTDELQTSHGDDD